LRRAPGCWLCAIDDSLYEAASNRRTLEKLDKWRDRLNVQSGLRETDRAGSPSLFQAPMR
jgi:hypothetical protein